MSNSNATFQELSEATGIEIAIVGMAGRFPGADDVDAFWRNVQGGVESVSRFTDGRRHARARDADAPS